MSADPQDLARVAAEAFTAAAAADRCWACGCLHAAVAAAERVHVDRPWPEVLVEAAASARARLKPSRYDCLGCAVCHGAVALNALSQMRPDVASPPAGEAAVQSRVGWPPWPGRYAVLRPDAPVAVCCLTDEPLSRALAEKAGPEVVIVGCLQTENLGIERMILNLLANPAIRFLLVCGADSDRPVSHWPGQSLVALAQAGVDGRGRIIGARGRRPVLANLERPAVEHFRRTVEVVDRVGERDIETLLAVGRACAARNPGPAEAFGRASPVPTVRGYRPRRTPLDPAGYAVIYVDQRRSLLSLEHYRNDGVLDAVIEGRTAAEVYTPAVERALVSRLDHAAYLGRELARAEAALVSGAAYVQDAAPGSDEPCLASVCGCHTGGEENHS